MNIHSSVQLAPAGELATGPVRLTLLPEAARFSLRLDPASAAAASKVLGLTLPVTIGTRAEAGSRSALCLGPDEWEILAGEEERAQIQAGFAAIYGETPHSLADVSDREVTVEIAGARAAELLSVACPIDLSRFAVGRGKRTLFDSVQIILHRDAEDRFRMEVWRSFLPHVWELLTTANRELAAGL